MTHEIQTHEFLLRQPAPKLEVLDGQVILKESNIQLGVPQEEAVDCLCLELLQVLEVGLSFVAEVILQDVGQEVALVLRERDVERVDLVQLLGNGCNVLPAQADGYRLSVTLNRCVINTSTQISTLSPGPLISKFLKSTLILKILNASSMISSPLMGWKAWLPGPSSLVLNGTRGKPHATLPLKSLYLECKAQVAHLLTIRSINNYYQAQQICRIYTFIGLAIAAINWIGSSHNSYCIDYMKKHGKVGNATSTNFFTSEFKLKPAEPSKQLRNRKMNTTLNNFKHQILQEQTKRQREQSKEKKPFIEQLKFLNHREDNFKPPQSITKRSLSKAKEQSRLKIESKNHQLFEQHYQEIPVTREEAERKKQVYHLLDVKRSKPIHLKNALKEKLEKTALEKFNEAISKENEENQNTVSEKTAQSLYKLLKTNRMNQMKQNKFKSLTSEHDEEQDNQQSYQDKKPSNEPSIVQNNRKSSETILMEPQKDTSIKEIIKNKNKQALFKTFEEKEKTAVDSSKKPHIPKPQPNGHFQAKNDVILFRKVPCDNSQKERFTSSQMEQQSQSDSFQLKQQSSIAPKNSMKKQQSEKIIEEAHTNKGSNGLQPNSFRKGSQKIIQNDTQKVVKPSILPKEAPPATTKQTFQQKKPTKTQTKIQEKPKRYEQSDLENIPSAEAVTKTTFRQSNDNPQRKNSSSKEGQMIQLNNNKIEVEKILTTKYFQGGDKPQTASNGYNKINPPPKLPTSILPKSHHTYSPASYEDQIEELDFGGGKLAPKQQPKRQENKNVLPKNIPETSGKPQQKKTEKKSQAIPASQSHHPPQQQSQVQQQQQQDMGLNDELQYYIQRVQDIGQYRINSKDLYTDKSIDKQLFKIHKICAYYMAHQFLFLATRTCNHFKSPNFQADFFEITCDELRQLKEEGVLDQEISNLEHHLQESKKLLKKCYEECKMYLKSQEQILILDGKTNYHIKCCAFLIKEFRKIYELYQKNQKNELLLQRCVYLIEIYCVLKLLNGEELKQYEEFEQIENPRQHIENYKKLLLIS